MSDYIFSTILERKW